MELTTDRLRLRDFELADFEAVHAFASREDVVTHVAWGPNSREDTQQFLDECLAGRGGEPRASYTLAIVPRGTDDRPVDPRTSAPHASCGVLGWRTKGCSATTSSSEGCLGTRCSSRSADPAGSQTSVRRSRRERTEVGTPLDGREDVDEVVDARLHRPEGGVHAGRHGSLARGPGHRDGVGQDHEDGSQQDAHDRCAHHATTSRSGAGTVRSTALRQRCPQSGRLQTAGGRGLPRLTNTRYRAFGHSLDVGQPSNE